MLKSILAILAAAITACAPAGAPITPTAPAPTGQPAMDTQAVAGPAIYFYGDSISDGQGFGDDEYPSPLNSIHQIANLMLDINCASGAQVKSDRGQDFNQIYYDASQGDFADGDFLLWENAGPTINDPDMYSRWLDLVLFATQHAAPLILTTTYDHGGFSDYNAPLESGVSLNGAVRRFAADNGVLLLDWDKLMRRSEERLGRFGGSLLLDGIHPNPFGNFVMAAGLLHYLGVSTDIPDLLGRLFSQREGDVPDMTGTIFHWGYNPSDKQRADLLDSFLEDVQSEIEPGAIALDCAPA